MVSDRDRQATRAAAQSRRILARLEAGVWDLLHLLDLGPLETDPIIQLLVEHMGGRLEHQVEHQEHQEKHQPTAWPFRPRRNLDLNLLSGINI